VQLTAEQELYVRRIIAQRLGALRNTTSSNPYVDGYNDAIRDAVVEVMGGDPLYVRERTMIDGPGGGSEPSEKRAIAKGKYVEDVFLPEPEDYPEGWDLP
jgi:hypothetical protein